MKQKTQQQRRDDTYALVLDCACKIFGEKGYANTSIQDIAALTGLTIRPIYHYFGNKKQLFLAVTEHYENLLAESLSAEFSAISKPSALAGWKAYTTMVDNSAFRRIVLEDAPNILGRERWAECAAVLTVKKRFFQSGYEEDDKKTELITRMMIAAFAEAALMRANNEQIDGHIEELINSLAP